MTAATPTKLTTRQKINMYVAKNKKKNPTKTTTKNIQLIIERINKWTRVTVSVNKWINEWMNKRHTYVRTYSLNVGNLPLNIEKKKRTSNYEFQKSQKSIFNGSDISRLLCFLKKKNLINLLTRPFFNSTKSF